jgi:hypothetical protein
MPDLTIPPTSTAGLTPPAPPTALSEEAELQQFIAANGLRADLDKAIAISREAFPAGSEVSVRLWRSPEEDDTRVIVDVRFESSATDASALYWKMLDRWTRELALRAQGFITLTYTCL